MGEIKLWEENFAYSYYLKLLCQEKKKAVIFEKEGLYFFKSNFVVWKLKKQTETISTRLVVNSQSGESETKYLRIKNWECLERRRA